VRRLPCFGSGGLNQPQERAGCASRLILERAGCASGLNPLTPTNARVQLRQRLHTSGTGGHLTLRLHVLARYMEAVALPTPGLAEARGGAVAAERGGWKAPVTSTSYGFDDYEGSDYEEGSLGLQLMRARQRGGGRPRSRTCADRFDWRT
jgi:hypothetical protein